jgi:phage terminase small subunit
MAEGEVKRTGLVFKTKAGVSRPNPAVYIAEAHKKTLLRLLIQFGFSPDARERAAPLSAASQNVQAAQQSVGRYLKTVI